MLKKYKGFLYCIPHPQNKAQLYPFRTFNKLEKIKNMKFSNESAELESDYILESSYKDSLNVYNSLSEQEKKLVSPSGNFDKKRILILYADYLIKMIIKNLLVY